MVSAVTEKNPEEIYENLKKILGDDCHQVFNDLAKSKN